jgi:hypothetical protein
MFTRISSSCEKEPYFFKVFATDQQPSIFSLFNRVTKHNLIRTAAFRPLSEFITKTITSFVKKINENSSLGTEAFFAKTATDCRRIQYGEYQAQEPGESLYHVLISATWTFRLT